MHRSMNITRTRCFCAEETYSDTVAIQIIRIIVFVIAFIWELIKYKYINFYIIS